MGHILTPAKVENKSNSQEKASLKTLHHRLLAGRIKASWKLLHSLPIVYRFNGERLGAEHAFGLPGSDFLDKSRCYEGENEANRLHFSSDHTDGGRQSYLADKPVPL